MWPNDGKRQQGLPGNHLPNLVIHLTSGGRWQVAGSTFFIEFPFRRGGVACSVAPACVRPMPPVSRSPFPPPPVTFGHFSPRALASKRISPLANGGARIHAQNRSVLWSLCKDCFLSSSGIKSSFN